MKKFTLVIVAMLFGIFAFAQSETNKIPQNTNKSVRSAWIGNSVFAGASLVPVSASTEYAIAPKLVNPNISGNITKVKFYSDATNYASSYGVTNNSYTIKIYEGNVLDFTAGYVDYANSGLTEVSSQDYTATADGLQEVVLNTPYEISAETNFYVSVVVNGNGAIFMGTSDESTLNQYVYTYEEGDEKVWFSNDWETAVFPFVLSVYVDDGGPLQTNCDLLATFYNAPETITITESESVTLCPVVWNLGPDGMTSALHFTISLGGTEYIRHTATYSEAYPFPSSGFLYLAQDSPDRNYTFTPAIFDELNLPANFDICLNVYYDGGTDPYEPNNTACIAVTRGGGSTTIDENIASEISVYPNPANDIFTVANAEGATIVVVNSLGQIVENIENANANQTIDAGNFANGTYFVKVNETVVKINIIK